MLTPAIDIEHPIGSHNMKTQLPTELPLAIFDSLPQIILRDTRLINHQMNNASLLCWSLAKLSALSQSPLAEHVKAIDFHTEQLYEVRPGTYRESSVDTREPFFGPRNQLTSDDRQKFDSWTESKARCYYTRDRIEQGYKAYETCRKELEHRIGLGERGPILNDCLPKFRNLLDLVS